MNRRIVGCLAALSAVVFACGQAYAIDTVKTADRAYTGEVTTASRDAITVVLRGSPAKVAVERIQSVTFGDEPTELKLARSAIAAGKFQEAVEGLGRISRVDLPKSFVADEAAYLTVLAQTRLAESNGQSFEAALTALSDLIAQRPDSFRYFATLELLAETQLLAGRYAAARNTYDTLSASGSQTYILRAAIGAAKSIQAEGEFAAALGEFDKILGGKTIDKISQSPLLDAVVGRANCLSMAGKSAAAVTYLEGFIAELAVENNHAHAAAYNALGEAYRQLGQPKDALLAYLHVDVLFFQDSATHAEALANLSKLWQELGRQDRAAAAKQSLATKYPNSSWNRSS